MKEGNREGRGLLLLPRLETSRSSSAGLQRPLQAAESCTSLSELRLRTGPFCSPRLPGSPLTKQDCSPTHTPFTQTLAHRGTWRIATGQLCLHGPYSACFRGWGWAGTAADLLSFPLEKVFLGTSRLLRCWAKRSAFLNPHLSPSPHREGDSVSIEPSVLVVKLWSQLLNLSMLKCPYLEKGGRLMVIGHPHLSRVLTRLKDLKHLYIFNVFIIYAYKLSYINWHIVFNENYLFLFEEIRERGNI